MARLQARTRGEWEKSRHERLLCLTQALRKLESLPDEHQQDILTTLQNDSNLNSLSLSKDEEDYTDTTPDLTATPPAFQVHPAETSTPSSLGNLPADTSTPDQPTPTGDTSEPAKPNVFIDNARDVLATDGLPENSDIIHKEPATDVDLHALAADKPSRGLHDARSADKPTLMDKTPANKDGSSTTATDNPTDSGNQAATPSKSSTLGDRASVAIASYGSDSDDLAAAQESPGEPKPVRDDPTSITQIADAIPFGGTAITPEVLGSSTGNYQAVTQLRQVRSRK